MSRRVHLLSPVGGDSSALRLLLYSLCYAVAVLPRVPFWGFPLPDVCCTLGGQFFLPMSCQ